MSIHLHFAGAGSKEADQYLRDIGAYRLFSQANEKKHLEAWETDNKGQMLLVDSGAFSVAHSGAVVDIDVYIEYIKQHQGIANWVELDVIPFPVLNRDTALESCELSWQNYLYMKERLPNTITLLPLYHFGEPEFALTRILNTYVGDALPTYIGVGGRHGVSTEEQIKYFEWVFDTIEHSSNPNVHVHAFGITTPEILERFPFYSADSTAWVKAAAFGEIMLRHTLQRVTVSSETQHHQRNIVHLPKEGMRALKESVEHFGYTIEQLSIEPLARQKYNIDVLFEWSQNCSVRERSFKQNILF